MSNERHLDDLIDRLKRAEQAVAGAHDDYLRLRSSVDTAGELALWQRLECAERALQAAIGELDKIVYPPEPTSSARCRGADAS